MYKSRIYWRDITAQGEVNGRWVIEVREGLPFYPAGTLVCEPAHNEPDDLTFTAPNGKRYWDTSGHSQWTPRAT
jgi:hypothetical protein